MAKETAEKVNRAILDQGISSIPIRAIRRLPSGDIAIISANEEERKKLLSNQHWMKALGQHAAEAARRYGILVTSVQYDLIDTTDQQSAISRIQSENRNTLDLDITSISWLVKQREEKTSGSLIIECKRPEQANDAIDKGIAIGMEIRRVSVYNRACKSRQCFVCWQYGHLSHSCSKKDDPTCGRCTAKHHHKDCKEAYRCAACGGNHVAWDKACKRKKEEIERIKTARWNTPARFEVRGRRTQSHSSEDPPRLLPLPQDQSSQSERPHGRSNNPIGVWEDVITAGKRRRINKDNFRYPSALSQASGNISNTPSIRQSHGRRSTRSCSRSAVAIEAEDTENDISQGVLRDPSSLVYQDAYTKETTGRRKATGKLATAADNTDAMDDTPDN